MKKILFILLLSLFLFSCSEEEVIKEVVKKDFFIETKKIDDFGKDLFFNKTGKVSSSQNINITSQVSGRVKDIYVKEGQEVNVGDIIARFDDNIANYGLALERAQNTLDKAYLNYENTENQLNKSINDLKINLNNLKIDGYNSKSSLQLEKINNSIKKTTIDYENLKTSNIQTIDGFKNSFNKDFIIFKNFTNDIIDFSDSLLGITPENKDDNNSFETFLGAKDSNQKGITEKLLGDLISYYDNDLMKVNYNFEGEGLFDSNILIINEGYSKISALLNSLEETLDNSIPSVGSLSESTISSYKTTISTFWVSYNQNNSSFISLKNSTRSFLETYKNTEASLLKQIELLVADRDIYIKGLDTSLEIDESTLNEAIKNKGLTLRQLDAAIKDANIGYKQALNNYNKLTIKAPISGLIENISIDVGQEISPGISLLDISGNKDNEVIISFNKNELNSVKVGNIAYINYNGTKYIGSIFSISSVADSNLKYVSRISFDDGVNFIGDVVNVEIPFRTGENLLPINIMKINDSGKGVVNILNNGVITQKQLTVGKIYGDKIEILDNIDANDEIIITNINNYDSTKFNLITR